ncbi:MAG: hypothetical protein CVU95_02670 [Firmicutes bacterium HGW-Firmicutes-2]|jgi:hypothetical protein|nr:MAG: hypothetical protein CVU95_02670 [Firmicutes bacterium HGW-Firmicutes-2]
MKINFEEPALLIRPGTFIQENHYYHKVVNAQISQQVLFFLNMDTDRIIERYCHLNPRVDSDGLTRLLNYRPNHIQWSGTDLFHVTTANGKRQMVVIETNSSPSGQKSMPLLFDQEEMGGYQRLIETSFLPLVKEKRVVSGHYAIIYDKNEMEASGYAAALAQITGEDVYLASFYDGDPNPSVRFVDEVMEVRDQDGNWFPIKAAIRYVTQTPWNRIPVKSKTLIYNPIIACLAGGRNKRMAAKAYDFYNGDLKNYGLKINTPETIKDVKLHEIPLWVDRFGGHAVIKNPYSNAGQGVFTITCKQELDHFMALSHPYEDFIVQSLIGNYHWSTNGSDGLYYHVGMVPNKKKEIYVADLRFMIASTPNGYRPIAMYARRAESPLTTNLEPSEDSWQMLGTNLSIKMVDGWASETGRLKLVDQKDFNQLGLSLDSLIEGYIQSVLSTIAIDKLAAELVNTKKQLRRKLFMAINGDPILMDEII